MILSSCCPRRPLFFRQLSASAVTFVTVRIPIIYTLLKFKPILEISPVVPQLVLFADK
jgi:hypothetical protein